jgi:hypothetical protein
MAEVITTDEFLAWFEALSEVHAKATAQVIEMLEVEGTELGFPRSSALHGSKYALRELRVKAGGAQIRIAYAFDPCRDAVLILGGAKEGDSRFYTWFIPDAEKIWEQYLAEQEGVKS